MMPVRMLKNAIKLMTQETLSKMSSTRVNTWRKSIMDRLGNLETRSRCKTAELDSSLTVVVKTLNCGASSSTPAGNTTVKLICNCVQSTFRILPTVVSINTPCTLKTMVSPRVTFASSERLSEMEITTGSPGFSRGTHLPASNSSEAVRASRYVVLNS